MDSTRVTDDTTTTTPQSTRVIKRYANRKLYDTRDSRYVTLIQIADYIKAGEEVQIIDNNSKEDLTTITLAQIIYEQEKNGEADARKKTISTLRNFIQEGGQKLMESLREGSVGKLIPAKDGVHSASEPLNEDKKRTILDKSREALEELQRAADDRGRALIASAIAPVHHLQAEVKRLQSRIEELEAKLVKASQPRQSVTPAAPSQSKSEVKSTKKGAE